MAETSPVTRRNEETLTYLNQGNRVILSVAKFNDIVREEQRRIKVSDATGSIRRANFNSDTVRYRHASSRV